MDKTVKIKLIMINKTLRFFRALVLHFLFVLDL